ncbi:uncharacterized protein LOC128233430 isoform X2 [Mya arenaria]|uniref:uncharacterized protein LOC128233430 isoform X2 n=1 Tax=Mya arenaria TaxID=6604 RepID=UPI0022E5D876|nr:uncharacterized protein LOC128233430 isoform X2 [Mya arenaria]
MPTKVMNSKGRILSFSLLYGVLVMIVLNPAPVSPTLCESRCENAVPYLRRLKTLWHHLSKREGSDDISFTEFIQSLMYAARRYGKLSPLKQDLLQMVIEYKDCVKACEHQHSKRSGNSNGITAINRICTRGLICIFEE